MLLRVGRLAGMNPIHPDPLQGGISSERYCTTKPGRAQASQPQPSNSRKRRIARRLQHDQGDVRDEPVMSAGNIDYEVGGRASALGAGGIGAIHAMARHLNLDHLINARVPLLQVHKPYSESDHVFNIAFNILCGGRCLEDLELRRYDEAYLNALGADRVPDPTTAGDFCRRFTEPDIQALMNTINQVRRTVWQKQPEDFFDLAVLDADGLMAATTGECKQGMDISYNGLWGYQVGVVSLANTAEPLFVVNRPGNRPSHEGAAWYLDRAARECTEAGFRQVRMRGDTDFTQTTKLDHWDSRGYIFNFGMDAKQNLKNKAEAVAAADWELLERPPRYEIKTVTRRRPEDVKERIIKQRQYVTLRLRQEHVAELSYQPVACEKSYRLVIVRKLIERRDEQMRLFEEFRYHFYLSNDPTMSAAEIVLDANKRCDQENLIAQLKGEVRALHAPVDNLHSNWAYMVMASLAWTLKAWVGLCLPESPRWRARHRSEKCRILRMEFRTFCNRCRNIPAQVVRTGRRIIFRLLNWNPWQHILLRLVEAVRTPMQC